MKGLETLVQTYKRCLNFMTIGKTLQVTKPLCGVKNGIQDRLKIVG